MSRTHTDAPIAYERVTARPVDPRAAEQMVRMRDGVRLASDVYLPQPGCEPGPTVLIRLPYDKNGDYTYIPDIAAYMVARGYRVVAQDVRGKFRSEGESIIWVNEAYDGYDSIEWIVHQPWSDGVVGMWGDSYYGFTQLAAASTGHPALRAMVPRVTGTRLGEVPQRNGARTSDVEMLVARVYPVTHFQANDTYDWEADWTQRPFADQVERWFATVGERSPSYDLITPNQIPLRRFPAGHPFDAPPVPMLQTIGWWDNCAPWQWADHELIQSRPGWAQNEFLLLEDIDHENNTFAAVPYDVDQHPVTSADWRRSILPGYLDPALDFFDVFLRGLGRPQDIPRVRWRVAGEPRVRASEAWPPAGATVRTFHGSDDSLVDAPEPQESVREWTHDPDAPVPSPVANAFEYLREFPDERTLADRDDVLSFDAPRQREPLLLAGPVQASVTTCSTGPEMDVFARLADVAPDGSAHLIARGQVTLHEAAEFTAVRIDMGHTAYRVEVGHRLRLTIASSDFPEFLTAPGNGDDRWLATETEPNRQALRIGGVDGPALTVSVLAEDHE